MRSESAAAIAVLRSATSATIAADDTQFLLSNDFSNVDTEVVFNHRTVLWSRPSHAALSSLSSSALDFTCMYFKMPVPATATSDTSGTDFGSEILTPETLMTKRVVMLQ